MPPGFWRAVLEPVRRDHPTAWFVGELIHGDYAATVRDGDLDSATQYELWKAIWSALNDRNLFELSWALRRHEELRQAFDPQTFVGNHDTTRIASRLVDERHLEHALTILFTVPGVPSVYAGDEQAFRGVKEDRAGGDDAIRPPFPATPPDLAPYGWPVYRQHQRLIGLRRRHPWLRNAEVTVEHLTNETMTYWCSAGDQALLVALNLADTPTTVPFPAGTGRVEAGTATIGDGTVELPPHGTAVLTAAGARPLPLSGTSSRS